MGASHFTPCLHTLSPRFVEDEDEQAHHPPPPPPPPPPPEEPPPPLPELEPGGVEEELMAPVSEEPNEEAKPAAPRRSHEEPLYHEGE